MKGTRDLWTPLQHPGAPLHWHVVGLFPLVVRSFLQSLVSRIFKRMSDSPSCIFSTSFLKPFLDCGEIYAGIISTATEEAVSSNKMTSNESADSVWLGEVAGAFLSGNPSRGKAETGTSSNSGYLQKMKCNNNYSLYKRRCYAISCISFSADIGKWKRKDAIYSTLLSDVPVGSSGGP